MQICQPSTQFALKNDDTNKAKKTVKAHLQTRKANGMQKDNKQKPPKQRNGRHSGKKTHERRGSDTDENLQTSTRCKSEHYCSRNE